MTRLIGRYLHITIIHYPSFSSDGRQLAFLCNISGLPQVWRVTLPFKSNQPLWPPTNSPSNPIGCSPAKDDGRLIFASDVGGNENAQLYLLSPNDTDILLTEGHKGAKPFQWKNCHIGQM